MKKLSIVILLIGMMQLNLSAQNTQTAPKNEVSLSVGGPTMLNFSFGSFEAIGSIFASALTFGLAPYHLTDIKSKTGGIGLSYQYHFHRTGSIRYCCACRCFLQILALHPITF